MNLVNRSKSKGCGPVWRGDSSGDNLAGFSLKSSNSTPEEMKDLGSLVGRRACLVRNAVIVWAVVSAMPPRIC